MCGTHNIRREDVWGSHPYAREFEGQTGIGISGLWIRFYRLGFGIEGRGFEGITRFGCRICGALNHKVVRNPT